MAYQILKSDGTIFLTLEDEQTSEISGVKLIGKNILNYGKDINENYVKIIENFAKNEPPSNAMLGQLWWDKITNSLKVNSSSTTIANWKRIGHIATSSTEPSVKIIGDLWWDTNSVGRLRIWDGSSWKVIGPRAEDSDQTQTGAIADVITDTSSLPHLVIKFVISDFLVAILSRDAEFSPSPPITGFSTISRGLNISSQITDGGIKTGSIATNFSGIFPLTSTVDIGSSVNKFRNIFSTNFVGNASTSSTLQTARKINGTDFDGSTDITTTKWGTPRSVTIGNSTKIIDGGDNIVFSLNEVGSASSSTEIIAGNGLSGGGNLSGSVTISLGTPDTIFSSSGNVVTETGHTHAVVLSKSDVGLGNVVDVRQAASTTAIIAGNGIIGGGDFSETRTLSLGTPGTITGNTQNTVSETSHTHAISVASTSVRGIVQLASNSETQAGVSSTTAVTPSSLASFAKVLNETGYANIPGGIIMQWGRIPLSSNENTEGTIIFPIEFPTACLQVITTVEGNSTNTNDAFEAYLISGSITKTTAKVRFGSHTSSWSSTNYVRYIAIGH